MFIFIYREEEERERIEQKRIEDAKRPTYGPPIAPEKPKIEGLPDGCKVNFVPVDEKGKRIEKQKGIKSKYQ